jgi:hypothetical protein
MRFKYKDAYYIQTTEEVTGICTGCCFFSRVGWNKEENPVVGCLVLLLDDWPKDRKFRCSNTIFKKDKLSGMLENMLEEDK